jgi:hypothetical protein
MASEVKLADLVLDYTIYPRHQINSQHVGYIEDAMNGEHEFPPVVVDKASMRVVDGFHRISAARRVRGLDGTIAAILKPYPSEAAIIEDAISYNSSHGRSLTPYDRARCLQLAHEHGISRERACDLLRWPSGKDTLVRRTRLSGPLTSGRQVPLKRTIERFHGKKLTERQLEANDKLSGMNQSFYALQLIELIEADLLYTDDEKVMQTLVCLRDLLDTVLERVAA